MPKNSKPEESDKKDDGISSAENPEKDELKSPNKEALSLLRSKKRERREKIKREILVLILAKLEDFAPNLQAHRKRG